MTRKYVVFIFYLIFTQCRMFVGSLPVMKRGVFNRTRKQN